MSVSNDSTVRSTIDAGRASLSSPFLKFCAQVRNNDPSILPEPGKPLRIRHSSDKEDIELADALLENTNVTYLELEAGLYTKSSPEAMAKYIRTSKRLQRIRWKGARYPQFWNCEETLSCFLHAVQESTSLKELHIDFPSTGGGPSRLALENLLTHTQSLRSMSLSCPDDSLEDWAAVASSGLRKNTSLRELTLEFGGFASTSPIFTSVRDHPHLRRLCLRGHMSDVAGLETFLLSDTSKITELDIDRLYFLPITGSTPILQALASRPTLTKLGLHRYPLGRDDASLLCAALRNMPSLQTLDLARSHLGSAGLEELTSALYHNKSIEVLDLSLNRLDGMESAEILRDILRSNKTITALNLSGNTFGRTPGAVERIADGLGSNSTLLTINYSSCSLGDDGVTTLAQTLGSRNTTLQKLTLTWNAITSTDFGMLLETMEQSSHIADLDLCGNYFGDGGAVLLARSLGNNALPNLTQLSLCDCGISDDGFIALMSALEHNTSLIHLDLRYNYFGIIEQGAFLALAKSLPEIKVLQRIDLTWCTYLASAMPLLLAGLHKNTSLFRIHVASCAPSYVPPTTEEMAKFAGGWMQEMERLGYRNRFLPIIRAPKERLPAHGVWPRALALAATLPDVIFDVLRSKPSLVLSADREGKKAALDTGVPCKRKRGDE
jgi:Ran GTPase-activating protein (RanGAP) involved in mRNA processing and transport